MERWIFFNIWLAVCSGTALFLGGAPERIGAIIFLVATLSTAALGSPFVGRFGHVETGILLCDIVVLVALFILARRAQRLWPLWACGLMLAEVADHGFRALAPEVLPLSYSEMIALWSYPILGLLLGGTLYRRQRLARFGVDEDWRS